MAPGERLNWPGKSRFDYFSLRRLFFAEQRMVKTASSSNQLIEFERNCCSLILMFLIFAIFPNKKNESLDLLKFCFKINQSYRVCHGFRFSKPADYFWVDFDLFWSNAQSRNLRLIQPCSDNVYIDYRIGSRSKMYPRTSSLIVCLWLHFHSHFEDPLIATRISFRCTYLTRIHVVQKCPHNIYFANS